MYVSKVMVLFAERIAASIAGKISSPFRSVATSLPSTIAGPSSTPMARVNCGSSTPYEWRTSRRIFFSGSLKRFTPRIVTTAVTRTIRTRRGIVVRILATPY